MKKLALVFATVVSFTVLGTHRAHAQAYGYYLVNFQCDPVSCEEQGPTATESYAEVQYYGDCALPDGGDAPLDGRSEAFVGINGPCSVPYYPIASAWTSSGTLFDANGDPYNVDYVTSIAEIFAASGTIVDYNSGTFGCDGSVSGGGPASSPC
jgi:hypothetical protein